ncbi:MAG: ATP-binding protein [Elusimicrobiales bacterium]|nr:ATP-binding protein [Elusimicrobiales bacterium]
MKIRAKLLLFLVPLLLLSGVVINYLTGRAVCNTLHGETAAAAAAGARRLLEAAAVDFSAPREDKLLPFLYSLVGDLNASNACFADKDGNILAHTDVARKGKKIPEAHAAKFLSAAGGYEIPVHGEAGLMRVYVPVNAPKSESPEELALLGAGTEAKRLGTLVIYIQLRGLIETERYIARKTTTILAAVYSAILLAAFFISGAALRPIRRLIAGTERIRLGDYETMIPVASRDEFGDLARSFNSMTRTLSGTIVSKNYLDAILDNMLDVLVVVGLDGRIQKGNRAALAALGGGSALEGRMITDFLPGEEEGSGRARVQSDGEVRDHEAVMITGAGARVPVLISASRITDPDGKITGTVVSIRDITSIKKYEAELARSNEDLQRFAFVASHDLQEPLKTISNYVQMLEAKYRSVMGPESEKHVDFITGAVGRMRSLIRGLLDYSKINSSLHLEEVDSREALDYVLGVLGDSISSSGAVIERGDLPVLRADRCHIESLLQNLISNAIKFRNGAAPRIRVSAEKGKSGWIFEVRDNGAGIENAYSAKLFKLFGRLHGKGVEGAGIGLASCKKIVEHYGGKIWFESEPGKGSSFFFSIPGQPG